MSAITDTTCGPPFSSDDNVGAVGRGCPALPLARGSHRRSQGRTRSDVSNQADYKSVCNETRRSLQIHSFQLRTLVNHPHPMAPAPTPFHILRSHASPLAAITFNPSNTLVYAGDQDGNISITDLRSRRTVSSWRAHEGGILTLQEWNGSLIR